MALITAAQWLSEFEEVKLPSGKEVGLRKADPFSLIMTDGRIPDLLTNMMSEGLKNKGVVSEEEMKSKIDANPETIEEMVMILNRVAHACMASPTVSLEDISDIENNVIGISKVSFGDKMFMLSWTMGEEGLSAQSFLEKQEGSILSVGSIPGVQVSPQ